MKVPYVHSNFKRMANDNYQTIDPRCVDGFLQHVHPTGLCLDVCAPDGSGIVDQLVQRGYEARGHPDAFDNGLRAQWIITNPPYKVPLVDQIIMRQLLRLSLREVEGVAMLLRSNFDFAKGRESMFIHGLYAGQIKLCFRPWWSEERKAQPIHNYVWHLWARIPVRPLVYYSYPID